MALALASAASPKVNMRNARQKVSGTARYIMTANPTKLTGNAGKDALEVLFKQYANLVKVRTIPGRANIAFVKYTNATSSGVAKDALHNYKFDGEHKIKVTFVFTALDVQGKLLKSSGISD